MKPKRPRVVLMLDPELDDQNTMIRYLLYSNHFETLGIIYTSSVFHWKGDGQGTPFSGPSEHQRFGLSQPLSSWRWNEDESFLEDAIDIYAQVYPNLVVHAEGYPPPEELRARVLYGNVEFPGDISKDSPGSNLIKNLLLDDTHSPLYLLTGAGHSTIGRALYTIEEEYRNSPEWPEIYRRVSKKAIIQAWGDQDDVYADYIGPNWPGIEFREMSCTVWGYEARSAVLPEDRHYLSAEWTRENVSQVGPFGAFYRVWGDGKQMVTGDITDHFGFSGLDTAQLRELGYIVWTPPQEPGSWISEGDTPIFLNLIDNGLLGHVNSSYGGWGGRNGMDIDPSGIASKEYAVARWFGAAQRDFAARMRWSVTPEYSDANHNPVVEVISPPGSSCSVRPGERVTLKAVVTDPDGDHVRARWWRYSDADTYPGAIEMEHVESDGKTGEGWVVPTPQVPGAEAVDKVTRSRIEVTSQFTVPPDAADGQTLHFILEATDNGEPNLTCYQRVILTVSR